MRPGQRVPSSVSCLAAADGMSEHEMSDAAGKASEGPARPRPAGPYWEDPVYRYVSRRHRSAAAAGDGPEAARFDTLMQALAGGSMPDEVYWQLEVTAETPGIDLKVTFDLPIYEGVPDDLVEQRP